MADNYELTGDQVEIVKAEQSTRIIVAPPGSGKTEALALRAKGLIERGLVERPHKVLAVTFSNRARDNLLERLRRVVGARETQRFVKVSNFHGFAARVYWAHGDQIGHDLGRSLVPFRGWLESELKSRGASRAQTKQVKRLLQELKLQPITDQELLVELLATQVELAYDIEVTRQKAQQLDYADLLRYARMLLHIPRIASLYRSHFAHILVDEFQDTTHQHVDLIESIARENVTWAGDPGQAIYSFTGADPLAIYTHLKGRAIHEHKFEETHRSSPAVVRVINAISSLAGLGEMRCVKPEKWPAGGAAMAFRFRDRLAEATCVRYLVEELIGDDGGASVAIITRTEFRRRELDREFNANYRGEKRFWTSAITSTRTAQLLNRSMSALSDLADDPQSLVSEVVERTRLLVAESEIDCLEELRLCDTWLRDAVETGLSVSEAIARIQITDDADVTIQPGAHLLNAHVGKGQEFDHVIVCGVEEQVIPSKFALTDDEIAEELRVLRVIVSRAKTSCIFTRAESWEGWYRINSSIQSRWWSTVEGACHP